MSSCFSLKTQGKVAEITFNRPEKRNSFLPDFWTEFPAAVAELSQRGDVRCIIIQAEGKHFSSGMDLSVFASPGKFLSATPHQREQLRNLILILQQALTSLEKCRIPVIAAIQGGCLGAALDLVCACDFRYATDDAYFCIQETNIGILADLGTLQRLPRKMPEGAVRELAYAGTKLSAHRARDLGFVNEVFDDVSEMQEHALKVAEVIAGKPPLVVAAAKECINYAMNHDIQDSLQYVANMQAFVFDPFDVTRQMQSKGEPPEHADLRPISSSL